MSMYKTIFVNTDWENESAGAQVANINGEVLLFGETAFSSVEEAIAAVGNNSAIVIKSVSGKYDSFSVDAIITDGMISSPTRVVAVDFDGGVMTTAEGDVSVADTGFSAETQLSVIADLNSSNAANGTVYVQADSNIESDTRLFVGMGEFDYVVGTDSSVIYAENSKDVVANLENMENISTFTSNEIYINTDYNEETAGWGTTHFSSYSSAYSYATVNAKSSTMVIEKGSNTYIDNNHKNFTKLNVTVKDGARIYYAGNKLDVTYDVMLKAGAEFITARGKNSTSYTHIKDGGSLTIGEAGADKKAVFDFGTQANAHSIDVAVLWQGSLNAVNAIIKVGDFGFTGVASFVDCEVTVEGIVAFGKGFFTQTMTNTTMNVGGHSLRADNTYFNPSGTLLNNLTMTNSTINVNDGVDGTTSDKVTIKKLTMNGSTVKTEGAVEIAGSLTIDSGSSLVADTLTFGASGKITINFAGGFDPSKPIIDITGANGLTETDLAKIKVNGGSIYLKDGDIFAGTPVEVTTDAEGNKELNLGVAGAFSKDTEIEGEEIRITTDSETDKVTDSAQLNATVTGTNVELENTKNLAVTGSIEASDSVEITNAGSDAAGNEATLNGGAAGTNAKITATETITMQNDGHAEVELNAKDIIIANNSTNTLIGNIGTAGTESIVIGTGKITENGIDTDGYGDVDGSIENAVITATTISIDNQSVEDSTLNGKVTVTGDSEFNDVTVTGANLFVKDNFTANGEVNYKQVNFYGKTVIEDGATLTGGTTIVSAGDEFTLKNGAEINSRFFNVVGGTADIYGDINLNHSDPRRNLLQVHENGVANIKEGGNVTITRHNAIVNAGGTLNVDGGTLTITADTVNVAPDRGGNIYNSGAVNVKAGTVDIKNLTNEAGATVAVSGGELNISDTLTNNGTFTVAGESTLDIAELTGNTITALDGTKLTDTTIASALSTELVIGEQGVASTVTFAGDNKIAKISAGAGDSVIVEAGASLELTGNRSAIGSGATWSINGNIADAKAVTDEEKAGLTVAFNAVNGLSLSDYSGSTTTWNINDAYAKVGTANGVTSKNDNNAGGKFEINITNSIFESASKWAINTPKNNTITNQPAFELNVKDSVFTVSNYYINNQKNSVANVDNSKFSATAFGNIGEFNVTRGSEVEFTLVNNALNDWAGKGGLNAGSMSIDASDLTINNTGATLEFYNVGDLSLTNGATLDIDKLVNAKADDLGGTAGISTTFAGMTGEISVDNATLIATSVSNTGTINVSGESTLNIAELTGNRINLADGTTLTDSNVGGSVTMNGDLTIVDGDDADANGLTLSGGLWASNGGTLSGDTLSAYYAMFQTGTYTISADLELVYGYLSFGGTFTVSSTIHTTGTNGEVLYVRGDVDLITGAVIDADKGLFLDNDNAVLDVLSGAKIDASSVKLTTSGAKLNVIDGEVIAGSIVNSGTISLTVTDEKLASLGGSAYYMVNQTGSGAALDLGINYNGNVYNIGDSITIGDVIYNVTEGDGNDIAIQAEAKTVVIDSTLTTNGLDKFAQAGEFFELHDSYDERIQGNPEKIVVNGTNVLDTDKSKYFVYTDSDLSISGGTLDVSKAGRFYFMDTVAPNGTAIENADFSDVATVTIEEGATLKGYINLGQAIDNGDFDETGNAKRDGGAVNMVVKGTLDQKNLYVNTGSTLTVTETGKVTHYPGGGDNHIRANAKVVVNGTGKDGDVQFASGWWSIRGGEMEFNNTNAETGTLRLNADNENALVTGDTTASLTVNNSRLDAYAIEVDNADSSFTAKDSIIETTLLENAGTVNISDSTVNAAKVDNSGTINVDRSQLKANSIANAGVLNIFNSTLENTVITGSEGAVFRAENAVLKNLNVSGQETRTVNTDFNGGTYTGKVYTGYGLVDGEWVRVADSETTITGTVDASSVYWQNYGKLTIAEGAELKTSYFSEGSRQVLTVDGTISAGTFRGYNGVVSETGKINAQAAVQFYGNPDTKRKYDINGEVVVTHDIAYAHNIVVGFDTAKQWYGDGPNDYWNIGGANTEVNVSGEKAKLQIVAGKAGKGTAMIHVDEEGTKATLNISDKARFLVDGKVINNGNLNIAGNAVAVITGNVTNSGSITVDASSSFSAGAIVNNGSFNSDNAGEMVVLGDITVSGNIQTADLILNRGAALSAGSITVDNLTLALGSELSLTGTGSSVAADFITVTGEIGSAEYQLVLTGWTGDLLGKEVKFDLDGNGAISNDEIFTVQNDTTNLSGVNFVAKDGNLYVKDFGAATSTLYIGDISGAVNDKIEVDGVSYTVGVDAFASAADAASAVDADAITEVTLGLDDHVDAVSNAFPNISKINVPKNAVIEDAAAAVFNGELVINNDGHLDADITAAGKVTLTNTSSNTFTGELIGADVDVVNTSTGKVTAATLTANDADGGMLRVDNQGVIENSDLIAVDGIVDLKGEGTFTNVDVTADTLYLNGIDFTLDGDSSVNSVYMDKLISADAGKLTLDGASVGVVYSSGTGEVEFTANSKLDNVSIENVDTVTLSGGTHQFSAITDTANESPLYYMNTLNIGNAAFNWNFSNEQEYDYNVGTPIDYDQGMIKVNSTGDNAVMNFNQNGTYDLKDLDVSNFGGAVNIADTAALDLEDATDYFKDGAVLDVDGVLNLKGAGAFTNTGMDFNGDGDINVMKDHTFTAAEALNGFSGDLTIGDDAVLTLDEINDTAAILHGKGDLITDNWLELDAAGALNDFTGNIEADGADSLVELDNANTTSATFSGEGKFVMDDNQILNAAGALDNVSGTVDVVDTFTTTLNGENTIKATLTGNGTVQANADQSFTGDVSAFTGSYSAAADQTVTFTASSTLAAEMELNGAGKFELADHNADVTVNSDTANATELVINNNKVTLTGGLYADITGEAGSLTIDSEITAADVKVGRVVINADDTLHANMVDAADVVVLIENTMDVGPAITVKNVSNFGNIAVAAWSSAFETPFTVVDSEVAQNYGDKVKFILSNSGMAGIYLEIDGMAQKIDGNFVRVYTVENDLLIGNYKGESNVVYVNSDWSKVAGTVEKWTVANTGKPSDTDRIIDLDASKTLENAVKIIRAEDDGKGQIYLVKGDTYSTPAALMTAENKVTDLVIEGNGFENFNNAQAEIKLGDAVIEGGVTAMESAASGSLTLKNVSVSGNVYGGAIVTGDAGNAADTTSLTLDGGAYQSANIAGGSFVKSGTYTVKSSELVIQNTTDEEMVILGRVLGGSVAKAGSVVQDSASVVIDTDDGKISVRGDIYAAGSGAGVSVENTQVTFTGDAANLTFTGRVSGGVHGQAVGTFAGNSELVFDDFNNGYGKVATFKGLIQDMDEVVISGNSKVTFSRKQTLMSDTDIVFDVDGMVAYKSTAMFTVNSFGWSYDDIVVKGGDLNSGTYTLAAGFDFAADNTIGYSVVNGTENITVSVNEWAEDAAGNRYLLTESANELYLQVVGSSDIVTANASGDVTLDNSDVRLVIGDNAVIDNNQPGKDVAALKEIVLGDNATFNFNNMSSSSSSYTDAGRWLKNSTITTTGDNAEVNIASTGKWVGAAGFTIGEGVTVTAENMGFDNSSSADTVINGTVIGTDIVQMNSYGQAGAVIVNGTLEAGAWGGIDVKNGTELVVTGTVATPGDLDIWTSTANSVTVNGGNVNVSGGGHIHIWDAAHTMNVSNGSTINYGYNFAVGNGGEGITVMVDNSTLNQSVASTSNSVIQNGNSVTLSNGSEWNLGDGKLSIVGSGALSVNTGSAVNGNIIGDAADNVVAMDINSILNGAVDLGDGNDTLNITGLTGLTADGFAGAKALVSGEVSNVEKIKIDGVAVAANGAATQVDTDLWAQVSNDSNGLVVGWGETAEAAGVALEAFEDATLTTGEALLASGSDLGADNALSKDDFKHNKNNGTLA